MVHQDSLEPAAIRFMLKCCQQSGYFLPAFFIHWNPREWLIVLKHFLWNLMDIVTFIKALQHKC